jgi:hypothetical protein
MVEEKKFNKILETNFLREDKMISDFFGHNNELKNKILNNYGHIKLDVVSLAELGSVV